MSGSWEAGIEHERKTIWMAYWKAIRRAEKTQNNLIESPRFSPLKVSFELNYWMEAKVLLTLDDAQKKTLSTNFSLL